MKKIPFKNSFGHAQIIDDKVWIHFGGRTFTTGSNRSSQRKASALATKSGNIVSPMPGKITKILVKPGDHVEENQSVLVMEAMKMEYSLKSQIKGTVKQVSHEVGTQVSLGAILAVIEKSDEK